MSGMEFNTVPHTFFYVSQNFYSLLAGCAAVMDVRIPVFISRSLTCTESDKL